MTIHSCFETVPDRVVSLENKFKRYGKIIGIDINSNGFGFIQFDQVEDAKRAVQNEVGTMLQGRKIG